VLLPISYEPTWMRMLAHFNPLYYLVEDSRLPASGAPAEVRAGACRRSFKWCRGVRAMPVARGRHLVRYRSCARLGRSVVPGKAIATWTRLGYVVHAAVHHVDIASGRRGVLRLPLPSTLEADLNLVPADEFRPEGPSFRALRGSPLQPLRVAAATSAEHFARLAVLIGYCERLA
jgi:hypothetical protein